MKKRIQTAVCVLAMMLAPVAMAGTDPLRATLEESMASGKGLNLYVQGQAIGAVVTRVDDQFVVARSQALGTIVIRLDRIDGVSGHVAAPGAEKKAK